MTTITTQDCIGAIIGCLASAIDIADDLIINSIGEAYLQRARAILQDIDDVNAMAREKQAQPRGPVRVLAPPYCFRPTTRLAYCTGMRRWPCSMNTIETRVAYTAGATHAGTTAEEAFTNVLMFRSNIRSSASSGIELTWSPA